MTGIKDGISGGLSLQDNSDTGLSESNFISIDEISNSGLNYQDVATEGFYVTPVWKWMVSDIEKLKELVPVLYKIKEENPEGNNRSNFASWQSPDDLHLRPEF